MADSLDPSNPLPAPGAPASPIPASIGKLETTFFLSLSFASILASGAVLVLAHRILLHNDRVRYGVARLPAALFSCAVVFALPVILRRRPGIIASLKGKSTAYYLGVIAVIFAACWLPAYLAGGFVQDDWRLLAAASVRKIIDLHPLYSWHALDSVDGNFRPLGTVLYFGYMLKAFGPAARAFTLGPFLVTLLASLVAFAIVRQLGYSRTAATAASLLFLTRGLNYTIVTWTAALGDSIAILFCGLTSLFLLKATRRRGSAALLYHLLAWLSFVLATLGKQSSFVTPLIVALLFLLRPGEARLPPLLRRIADASLGLLLYAATAAVVFLHSKSLLHAPSPYPISFSLRTLFQTFSYACWYFIVLIFPDRFPAANLLPAILGLTLVAALVLLAWKFPALLGDRPRDLIFAFLAAIASVSLFAFLGTRSAPYYGCMSAFWFSIALGIALTRLHPPPAKHAHTQLRSFLLCLLLVTGFAEIRLEQTGLFPSGGYIWGTFGMDTERSIHAHMQNLLAASPQANLLLLADCDPNPYTSMAILDAPEIQTILLYNNATRTYTANDLAGLRPHDSYAALNDPLSYNWTQPIDTAAAAAAVAHSNPLRLQCRNGKLDPIDSPN